MHLFLCAACNRHAGSPAATLPPHCMQVPSALPPPGVHAAMGDGEVYMLGASGNRVVAPLRRFQVGSGGDTYWSSV